MKRIPIISQKACKKLFADIEITDTQRKAQEEWFTQLGGGKLESETENYRWFEDVILKLVDEDGDLFWADEVWHLD